jgi:hypothetical protein
LRRHVPCRKSASALAAILLACAGLSGCGTTESESVDAADLSVADVAEDGAAIDVPLDVTATDTAAPDLPDTGVDATLPDVPDGCIPLCEGKKCGPDGCNGICGYCKTGQLCIDDGAKCSEFCKPLCDGKKCGDNGCGGDCGACGDGLHCGLDFLCHENDCISDCGAMKCGLDTCGKSCGLCADGDWCDAGTCKPSPCKGIPDSGKCDGVVLSVCVGQGATAEKQLVDCSATPGKICGFDGLAGKYACIDKPACTPVCQATRNGQSVKLECGDNGCEGVCGVCASGWSCPDGQCIPQKGAACGPLPPQGQCMGDVWMFCNTGKIALIDCQADLGQTCGWDSKVGKFTCVP